MNNREDYLKDLETINAQIMAVVKEIADLDTKRATLKEKIKLLQQLKHSIAGFKVQPAQPIDAKVTNESSEKEKIILFRSLFRGREDVFPKRFESAKSGKSGYQPSCNNEWKKGLCKKPKIKCANCDSRDFIPLSIDIIRNHLMGKDVKSRSKKDFTIGIYPMLPDETCWFLAVDFDKESWMKDSKAYLETCRSFCVPAILERSRSGNGGHIWIFFAEPIPAKLTRQLAHLCRF